MNTSKRKHLLTSETKSTTQTFSEFLADMQALASEMGPALREHPCSVWTEATSFVKSRFLVQSSATEVRVLEQASPNMESCAKQPLCIISDTSEDGNFVGKLSIWPSRYYTTLRPSVVN